jgi:hypothetical protein
MWRGSRALARLLRKKERRIEALASGLGMPDQEVLTD